MNSPRGTASPLFAANAAERRIWWRWTMLTIIGQGALYIGDVQFRNNLVVVGSIVFVSGIAIIVLGQWLLIRAGTRNAWLWIVLSLVGWSVGTGFAGVLGGQLQDWLDGMPSSPLGVAPLEPGRNWYALLVSSAFGGVIIGAVLGSLQWGVLRQSYDARWWIPASILSSLGSILFSDILSLARVPAFINVLIASAWSGAVLATALLYSIKRPKSEQEQTSISAH